MMTLYLDCIFGDTRLMIVCFLNMVINLLILTTNAARISGAETKKIAISLSLYNLFTIAFRTLNVIYAPLLATIIDNNAASGHENLIFIKLQFVILSSALGSALGFLILPTFVEIYTHGIKGLEVCRSFPRLAFTFATTPRYWERIPHSLRKPGFLGVNPLDFGDIPKSFLFFNIIGIAMWTIGVIAANYASVLNSDLVRTTVNLSGLVNGIGTVFLFALVDPVSSLVMDQTIAGTRKREHVRIMVIWLALGTILGNLLGTVLLAPAGHYIIWFSKVIGL